MSFVVGLACPGGASSLLYKIAAKNTRQRGLSLCGSSVDFPVDVEKLSNSRTSQERVQEMVLRQATRVRERMSESSRHGIDSWDLDEAYNRCLQLFAIDVSSNGLDTSPHNLFNIGLSSFVEAVAAVLSFWDQDEVKALAALGVWCRRTDELVDGINGCCATPEVLNRWEQRLIDLHEGRPHDMYDAALSDALSKYPIDLQLFKDLIQGMRMDMEKKRYENFDDLYLYMYHVAGAPMLMILQLWGVKPGAEASLESVYRSLLATSIALHLTDVLRDVTEDARMGRVYLPQDELARAGLSEHDLYSGKVSNEFRKYMKEQIRRARAYVDEGEKSIDEMNWSHRWILRAIALTNRQVLDAIEANDYDLSKPSPVEVPKLLQTLLIASGKTVAGIFMSP